MGIDGLLKFLKPVTQKQHISNFKNQRAGIDIMSWIYRGCYSCNFQLAQNVQSIKYLYYLLEMIEILGYYNIQPIFIFDGRSFDMKNDTNQKRIKQKQDYKAKAQQYLKQGKIEQARKYFSRCIFIDQKIISTTMNVMHSKNIPFYVAPYEADCQIAKLKKLGIIDVAISQDSDLIAYGVNTILKLNQNGDCDYIDPNKWAPRDVDSQYLKEYFAMGYVNRIEACILAGSDYNPSVKGIGIKRAVKHMYRQAKMSNVINKLKQQKIYSDRIPQNYQNLIQKAKMIFLFATVYNPITKQLQYLNPNMIDTDKPSDLSQEQLIKIVGDHYPQYIQKQVFIGKTRAKDLKQRQIAAVNIRQMFSINRQNMILHESLNRKKKEQQQKLRDQRQKQIVQNNIKVSEMKPNHSKAPTKQTSASKTQITEQEKQKKKLQRKNRIIKLQDVMNSVVRMCEQQQEEQEKQKQINKDTKIFDNPLTFINKKLIQVTTELQNHTKRLQNKDKDKDIYYSDQNSESQISSEHEQKQLKQYKNYNNHSNENQSQSQSQKKQQKKQQIQSQSQSIDLAFLNPFAKDLRANQKTASKQNTKMKK